MTGVIVPRAKPEPAAIASVSIGTDRARGGDVTPPSTGRDERRGRRGRKRKPEAGERVHTGVALGRVGETRKGVGAAGALAG